MFFKLVKVNSTSWAVVVVSMLAFYSDNLSSNPAEAFSFTVQFVFEKNENKQKDVGVGPLKKVNSNLNWPQQMSSVPESI